MSAAATILLAFPLVFLSARAHALGCAESEYRIIGLNRVKESWLRDYLSLQGRLTRDEQDAENIRSKILTTDIFTSAEVRLRQGSCEVEITVHEKWTTIPVVRGAYGGGTPLIILGGYETNAFGELLALGAEARRYGDMAPGAFFFFKSPRAWRGRGSWGGELWLDRRRRAFFDGNQVAYGYADSESWTLKTQWLAPLSDDESSNFQLGFQAQVFQEKQTTFHLYPDSGSEAMDAPHDLRISDKGSEGGLFAPLVAYDDLTIDGLNASGVKARLSSGGARGGGRAGSFAETEAFVYLLPYKDLNFAFHLSGSTTTQNTVGGVYYLGGFDSVRGLPDGIRYGNRIIYTNTEARWIASRFKYAHIQPAVFYDTGSAWMNDHDPMGGRETSVGVGVRIAVPQIYRFVVRIDYGRSIGPTKSSGLSIGLNQFFQPYKMTF